MSLLHTDDRLTMSERVRLGLLWLLIAGYYFGILYASIETADAFAPEGNFVVGLVILLLVVEGLTRVLLPTFKVLVTKIIGKPEPVTPPPPENDNWLGGALDDLRERRKSMPNGPTQE